MSTTTKRRRKVAPFTSSALLWHTADQRPSLKATRMSVTLAVGRGLSHTEKVDTRESAPLLLRIAEGPIRRTADIRKTEPNPRAGQFAYSVGLFRVYEDGTEGFENERGMEWTPDAWAYLPNAADYR